MFDRTRYVVRDANLDDAASLAALIVVEAHESEGRAVPLETATAAVTAVLRDPALGRYWVLADGADILGAIAAFREWSDWNNTAYWWISFAYVAPAMRGQGAVDRLFSVVVAAARAAGAPEIRLNVHPDNARAIRAYERLGFQPMLYRGMTLALPRGEPIAPVELSDDALWRAFHDRTLPAAQWTHAAHLRVAWLHLARYALDEAHIHMRTGICSLNTVHGLVQTVDRGYHETLTRVWLFLVADARRLAPHADSLSFLVAHALPRDAPLRHYSRERLFSPAARAIFLSPDLAPLPAI